MVSRRRLLDEDVEGGPGEVAGAEGFDEGLLVDDAAAGAVDDASPTRQQGEFPSADHVAGGVAAWSVDGEEVAARQQMSEIRYALDTKLSGSVGSEERIEADDLHVQGDGAAGDLATDVPQADDA